MERPIVRRGACARQLALLDPLREILRGPSDPEEMVRLVTTLLAREVGQYGIADVIDRSGSLRRLVAAHADPGRIGRVLAACDRSDPGPRSASLFNAAAAELITDVTREESTTRLADLDFLQRERIRSYMAQPLIVDGAPYGVLTLVMTTGPRRYGPEDMDLFEVVADWTGLGLENALRREAQPRLSSFPPADQPPANQPPAGSRRGFIH